MTVSEFPYFFSSKEFVTNRTTTDASHIIRKFMINVYSFLVI